MDSAPQFDRFTGQARRAIWLAYQEAQRFDHDYLASEHLLAGLLREGSVEIARVFRDQDLKPDDVLEKLEMTLALTESGPDTASIFLTPRAKQSLAQAVELARQAHAPLAGAPHILLSMMIDPETSTREFLENLGFDIERGERSLRDAALAPNRDLLVQAAPAGADGPRIDPTAFQLAQLLAGDGPHVDLHSSEFAAAVNPAISEVDFQLFLTQLMLGVTVGLACGYVRFGSIDGMVCVAVIFALVTCFRNSVLGACLGAALGVMIAQHLHRAPHVLDTPVEMLMSLALTGAFLGSFLGNYWRRYCPKYLHPSTTHQKPPGVV